MSSKMGGIVLSDEEDDIKEIKTTEIMEADIVTSSRSVIKPNEDNSDPDVCVLGEVSKFKSYPRGVIIAPSRRAEVHTHKTRIKSRRSSDGVQYCTIKKKHPSFHCMFSSSGARKRLFQMEESIRLEERRQYLELIRLFRASVGLTMILNAELIKRVYLQRILLPKTPLWNAPRPVPPVSSPPRSVVEVDLTSDIEAESDGNDVEVLHEDCASQMPEIEEIPLSSDEEVVYLEEEAEVPALSPDPIQSLKTHQEEPFSTCSYQTSLHPEDNTDKNINLRDDDIEVIDKSLQKDYLEYQLLHQMIINDSSQAKPEDVNENDLEESQPVITRDMQGLVYKAFVNKSNKVLIEAFGLEIRPSDIHTLKGDNWLNDEVINFYLCLLVERGKLSSYPSVYCFNTFFYVKLKASGHASLKRWTRKIDIFSYDLLIVPIHLKVHWTLACVNFIEKRIEYYDSMKGKDEECCKALLEYLKCEYLDKKKNIFMVSGWNLVNMEDIPEQLNGSDCGVFLCMYAEYICRLAKLTFTQRDMPYFRVKMAYEILTKKLLL